MTVANPDRRRARLDDALSNSSDLTTARVLAALASDLAAAPDLNGVLAAVLECAVTAVRCDWVSIQLSDGRSPATSTASDPRFNGTAIPQAAAVRISDTAVDKQWPGWSADLFGLGVHSVYAVELGAGRSAVGCIAFYSAHPNRFGPADRAVAGLLAVHATLAILATRSTANLAEAIETRTVLGQALGIVMERYGMDGDQAFALLRSCSQHNNLALGDITQTLVTAGHLPATPPWQRT